MKKFFEEFKKFITRGNVVDMAVGVIVGSAFTSIVNGLSNFILKPFINYLLTLIFGANSLSEVYTFLKTSYKDVLDEAGNVIGQELDLAQSIYIDWGSFINAIINFFIVAFVLFVIVKVFNKFRDDHQEMRKTISKKTLNRAERKELRAAGVKIRDKAAVEAYFAEKERLAAEKAAAEKAAAEEAARLQRAANPTTEDLLKMILAELQNK